MKSWGKRREQSRIELRSELGRTTKIKRKKRTRMKAMKEESQQQNKKNKIQGVKLRIK